MGKNKLTLRFDGLEEYIQRLENLDKDIRPVVEESLIESKRLVHQDIGTAMAPHNKTYRTIKSLVRGNKVEWNGSVASIDVGFDLDNGGMPSIYLMYGTPRMAKDQKLYNAIYGTTVRKKVAELQKKLFQEAVGERM